MDKSQVIKSMQIGHKKASYQLRVIDTKTQKSVNMTLYFEPDKKPRPSQLKRMVITALQEPEKE